MDVKWIERLISLVAALLLCLSATTEATTLPRTPADGRQPPSVPRFSGLFEENIGQFPPDVRFKMRGDGAILWLAEDALWLTLLSFPVGGGEREGSRRAADRVGDAGLALRLSFPGANPHPRLEPLRRREIRVSYFVGDGPADWHADVPVWGGVRYLGLYPGVDLEVAVERGFLVWRLVTRDGVQSLAAVRLRVEGAGGAALTDGLLRLNTADGGLALPLPTVSGAEPRGKPSLRRVGQAAFEVVAPFARSPATTLAAQAERGLVFGTFLGGDDNELNIAGVALDAQGNVYVAGETWSPTFPTSPGAYDSSLAGNADLFVAKLSPDGSQLLYSTFIGGDEGTDGNEMIYDLAVSDDGAAHIVGWSTAADFATTSGAYSTTPPECGGYVLKLNSSGALAYSTFIPSGSLPECLSVWAVAVDQAGMIYVTGDTFYPQTPTTPGAYDRTYNGDQDIFVLKLNPAGRGQDDLLYGTFVAQDSGPNAPGATARDIAVDGNGVVYVVGEAYGEFPTTPGAYDTTFNGDLPPSGVPYPANVIFFKLNPAGNGVADMLYSTYLGGTATINERGKGVAVDESGVAYLTGNTWATDFPTTTGALDPTYAPPGDCFVSKLNPAGNGAADLLYSTYLGGSGKTEPGCMAIAVDDTGDIYVTGKTFAYDFPLTANAYQGAYQGGGDAFVTRLRPQGAGPADLIYSTYLGGYEADTGTGIALGQDGAIYVAGETGSSDFPTTTGAYDPTFGGGSCGNYACHDAFVVALSPPSPDLSPSRKLVNPTTIVPTGTVTHTLSYTITLINSGDMTATAALLTDTLPLSLTLTTGPSCSGGACAYDAGNHVITWTGEVTPGGSILIAYTGLVSVAIGTTETVHFINVARSDDGINPPIVLQARSAVNPHDVYLPLVLRSHAP